MYFSRSIIICAAALTAAVSLTSCGNHGIIGKGKMAKIVSEVYLADEYAKMNSSVGEEADTVLLYNAVFKKYGCTLEQYRNSTMHYIADGKSYDKILKEASSILRARADMLDEGERKVITGNTRIISILNSRGGDYIFADEALRAERWLVAPSAKTSPRFFEKSCTDFPQNAEWWSNNMKQKRYDNILSEGIKGGAMPVMPARDEKFFVPEGAAARRARFRKDIAPDGSVDRTVSMKEAPVKRKFDGKKAAERERLIKEELQRERKEERAD